MLSLNEANWSLPDCAGHTISHIPVLHTSKYWFCFVFWTPVRFTETPHGVAVKIGFGLLTVVMPPRAVCRQFAVATGADVRWLFFIFIRINLFFKFYFSDCNKHVLHKWWCPWTVCFAQSTVQIGHRQERVLAKPFTVHALWEIKENRQRSHVYEFY